MDFVLRMQDGFARPSATRSASRNGRLIAQPRQGPAKDRLRAPRTESAQKIYDKAYHQNEAEAAAADGGPSKVKTASAEHEKQNKDNE
jgi:hypothetical protein